MARNIILHQGMTIDLLEPDGNIYTEPYSIEIFETMELTLECTPMGVSFFSWLGRAWKSERVWYGFDWIV